MKTIYALLFTVLFTLPLYSQGNNSKPGYALSFGIADNFKLDNFAFDLAVKKILDDKSQLRFFLSPRVTVNNSEETAQNNIKNEQNVSNYSIGIGADYIWIITNNDDINFFGGGGIIFSAGNEKNEKTLTDSAGRKNVIETKIPKWGAGLRGTLGVEWRVSDKIGLHSEYLFTALYSWDKFETSASLNGVNSPIVTKESSRFSLGSQVLFGVSIYF